jgi:hypothetical protein
MSEGIRMISIRMILFFTIAFFKQEKASLLVRKGKDKLSTGNGIPGEEKGEMTITEG